MVFPETPAEIVHEMARLEPEVMHDPEAAFRYRALGNVLMTTPGATALDALGFLKVAIHLLRHAGSIPEGDGAHADIRSCVLIAGGYVTGACAALEKATGARAANPLN